MSVGPLWTLDLIAYLARRKASALPPPTPRVSTTPPPPAAPLPPSASHPAYGPELPAVPLGTLSARYESRKGPAEVSTGKGDAGGVSYGTYQMATTRKVPQQFVEWLKVAHPDYNKALQGKEPGTDAFSTAWKDLAAKDTAGFGAAQHEFIRSGHYDPAEAKVEKRVPGLDFDARSAALRDVLWSTAVQHGPGGAGSVFKKALDGKDVAKMSDGDIIKAVYAERGRKDAGGKLARFPNCSDAVQASVAKRYVDEEKDAQKMLAAEPKR